MVKRFRQKSRFFRDDREVVSENLHFYASSSYLCPMIPIQKISLALLLCLHGACTGESDRSWPLCGDLEAFAMSVPGDTVPLFGIRHLPTGDTLAGGLRFTEVEADTFVVRATLPDGRIMAFSPRGLSIGGHLYDSFTRLMWNDSIESTYYIATAYKRSYYYFPRLRRFIDISHARIHRDGFNVPTANGDSVCYDHRGNIVNE